MATAPAKILLSKKRCRWCHKPYAKIGAQWWCATETCAQRLMASALYARQTKTNATIYLYVPLPPGAEFDQHPAKYKLFGGAAGGSKSHALRWGLYRWAIKFPGFRGLLLRETFAQLKQHHLDIMHSDAAVLRAHGVNAIFLKDDKEFIIEHGKQERSIIRAGHMDDPGAINNYLSTEYVVIAIDEGSQLPLRTDDGSILIPSLLTRARLIIPGLTEAGRQPEGWIATNPGGPSSLVLRDLFVHHTPNWEQFSAKFRSEYDPDDYTYIQANLEDNPYLPDDYETTLAGFSETRYQQMRWSDWDIVAGQFFSMWREQKDGRPYHVQSLGLSNLGEFTVTGGLDWGRTNPGWVGWNVHLPDGHYHLRRELKFVDRDVADVAADIKRINHELGVKHFRIYADPAIFNRSQETGEAISETFQRCGVPMLKGENNRLNGAERMRSLLRDDGHGTPWLTVDPSCTYFLRTIPMLQSDPKDPEDVDTRMDDHAYDGERMWAMSRPAPTAPRPPAEPPEGTWGHALRHVRNPQKAGIGSSLR